MNFSAITKERLVSSYTRQVGNDGAQKVKWDLSKRGMAKTLKVVKQAADQNANAVSIERQQNGNFVLYTNLNGTQYAVYVTPA